MIGEMTIADELKALKADNGLLKLSNEQLAHNYKQADQCAQEREVEILRLLREREKLAEAALNALIAIEGLDMPATKEMLRAALHSAGYEE